MSAVLNDFVTYLTPKVQGTLKGIAKLEILNEGTVMLDDTGARTGDEQADVTLKASEDTFRAILDGSQNPMMAFMSGKLKVDGSTTRALKVSEILTA